MEDSPKEHPMTVTKAHVVVLIMLFALIGCQNPSSPLPPVLGVSPAPGTLDASFGIGGIVNTPNIMGNASALQADAKIIVAGVSKNESRYDFALVRYRTDGSLDASFGTGGIVTTAVGSSNAWCNAVAIQTDGKIVAAGYARVGTHNAFALVRYNSDGSLDESFGTTGIVTTAIGLTSAMCYAVALQQDGKIIASGDSYNGSNDDITMVRYQTDGTLDIDFGTGGIVTTDIASRSDRCLAVTLQSDGKIVAAGGSWKDSREYFALVRYESSGALDDSFGTGGIVTTAIGFSYDVFVAIALQGDGKIVAAGASYDDPIISNYDFALVRYHSDGTLDASFGTEGKVRTPITYMDYPNDVAIQIDGKIIVVGSSNNGVSETFAIVRYKPDGTMDTSFGWDGVVKTPIGPGYDWGTSVEIQVDGKIVVVGNRQNESNFSSVAARYWP